MTLVSAVLIMVLGAFVAVTVLAQLRFSRTNRLVYAAHWLKWHDYCGLIPTWSFFTPDPARLNFELQYREQLSDGSLTGWRAIQTGRRSLGRGIWNPGMRREKAVVDLCARTVQLAGIPRVREPSPVLLTCVPYRALLRYVLQQPRLAVGAIQFMIMLRATGEEGTGTQLLYLSPLHTH